MANTSNLAIPLIEQSQAQKEVTANEAIAALDAAVAGRLTLTTTGGTTTLTVAQSRAAIIDVSGALASNSIIVVPASPRVFVVTNSTTGAYSVTVKTAAGTGVAVSTGAAVTLYCDGTNVANVTATSAAQPYDIGAFYPGKPSASSILMRVPMVRAVSIADDFAGSFASALAAATGSTAFDIQKNGASVGTLTFDAAATAGTFVTGSADVSLIAGDVLSIIAPAIPDATLANIGIMIKGSR